MWEYCNVFCVVILITLLLLNLYNRHPPLPRCEYEFVDGIALGSTINWSKVSYSDEKEVISG